MRIDSLAVNAVASIRYTVNVTGTGAGMFRNTTQILSSATFDPDSQPGSGTGDGQDDMAVFDLRTDNGAGGLSESPNPLQYPLPAVSPSQPTPDLAAADLSLDLTSDRLVIVPNGNVLLTMSIHNRGGLPATGVSVAYTLPSGLTSVSGSNVTTIGLQVRAGGITVPVDGTVIVSFTARYTSLSDLTCLAEIQTGNQPDPDSTPRNGNLNRGEDDEAVLRLRPGKQ